MVYKLQSIQPKQNQKQIMCKSNKVWCFKLEEKTTEVLKRTKTILSAF